MMDNSELKSLAFLFYHIHGLIAVISIVCVCVRGVSYALRISTFGQISQLVRKASSGRL